MNHALSYVQTHYGFGNTSVDIQLTGNVFTLLSPSVAANQIASTLALRGWQNPRVEVNDDGTFVAIVGGSVSDNLVLVARQFQDQLNNAFGGGAVFSGVTANTFTATVDVPITFDNTPTANAKPSGDFLTDIGKFLGFGDPTSWAGSLKVTAAAGGVIALAAIAIVLLKQKDSKR